MICRIRIIRSAADQVLVDLAHDDPKIVPEILRPSTIQQLHGNHALGGRVRILQRERLYIELQSFRAPA